MCCPVFFQLFCINKCVFTLYAFERHVFPLTDRFVSKQIPTLDGIETETESTKKTRFESQKVKVDIQLIPCSERIKNSWHNFPFSPDLWNPPKASTEPLLTSKCSWILNASSCGILSEQAVAYYWKNLYQANVYDCRKIRRCWYVVWSRYCPV